MSPEDKPKEKNWKRAAERENARRTASAPLLAHAGLIPMTTPEKVKVRAEANIEDFKRRMIEGAARAYESARRNRASLAWILSADELDTLDEGWEIRIKRGFPETHEYFAEYWYQLIKRLGDDEIKDHRELDADAAKLLLNVKVP